MVILLFEYLQGESGRGGRWYSVLASGRSNDVGALNDVNLSRNDFLLGRRYESTAAASDASDVPPPAEKYEYQAEVCWFLAIGYSFGSIFCGSEV